MSTDFVIFLKNVIDLPFPLAESAFVCYNNLYLKRRIVMDYRVAICDDSRRDAEYVLSLLESWASDNQISVHTECFPSAEAFLFHYAEDKNFDILLLDIEMGNMNGVELAKTVRRSNDGVQIVFISGFPDFIAEGYDVSALHYLMKPVDGKKLAEVLDRAAATIKKQPQTVLLPVGRETVRIKAEEVVFAESQAHYMIVHTSAEAYKCRMTISEMQALLGEGFARCHRSFLVGLRHVCRITKTDVCMDVGISLPLGRGMYDELNLALVVYLRGM